MADERSRAPHYFERMCDEVAELTAYGFSLSGTAPSPVLFLKGTLNAAEREGGPLLAGEDGAALRAALERLGYAPGDWAACSCDIYTSHGIWSHAEPQMLAEAIEVFDPELVIALDSPAARALSDAWDLSEALGVGAVRRIRGRRVLALGGFEAALSDPDGKQVMWARLKLVPPLGAPL